MNRVVITRLGTVIPFGSNVDVFSPSITNGISGAAPMTKFACESKKFDPLNHIEKAGAGKYDLFTPYASVSVEKVIKDSNSHFENLNKNRMGVIWGPRDGGIGIFHQ